MLQISGNRTCAVVSYQVADVIVKGLKKRSRKLVDDDFIIIVNYFNSRKLSTLN